MSRSIAANVLAIANKREKEYLKETEGGIIAKVQMDLDEYANRMKKWPYIIQLDGWGESKGYSRKDFPGQNYTNEKLESILKRLGFTCQFNSMTVYIAIPMWRKGEKKTIAQLMLYHHLNSVNKAIEEKKEKEETKAKADFEYVLSQLESGDFESQLSENGEGHIITVKLEEGVRTGIDYAKKLKRLMEKRGFQLGRFSYEPDTKLTLYLPKKK